MEIQKELLVSAMKKALPGIDAGSSVIIGADTFIFTNGNIYTYNNDIGVTVHLDATIKDLTGSVRAMELYALLNKLKEQVLKIQVLEDRWILKSGNARIEIMYINSDVYNYISKLFEEELEWKAVPEAFFELAKLGIFQGNTSTLSGICVKDNMMMSTDEQRIQFSTFEPSMESSFWISDSSMKELLKMDGIKEYALAKNQSWIHFRTSDDVIFSCKLLQQEAYPFAKIKKIVDGHVLEDGDVSGVLPSILQEVVEKASVFSINVESFAVVKLTFSSDGIEVYAERSAGNYSEKVPWEVKPSKKFEAVLINVDSNMIMNGLKQYKNFFIKTKGEGKAMTQHLVLYNEVSKQIMSTLS